MGSPLRCHLLIGQPASGKTTLAKALAPLRFCCSPWAFAFICEGLQRCQEAMAANGGPAGSASTDSQRSPGPGFANSQRRDRRLL